jgi:GNAT superfamily N-acetyltransferase
LHRAFKLSLATTLALFLPSLAGAQASPATFALVAHNDLANALPDAPSFLRQQQQRPTPTPAPATSTSQQPADQKPETSADQLKAEEKQRLLGVVPQFNVVENGQALPLTAGQKWHLALKSAIDPFYIGEAFLAGGYSEVADTNNGYGWGPAGYFKRVGSTYADNVDGAIIGNALLPSILHQDPRYFRQGAGSIKSRFVHAALSTVICRGDNGKNQFNTSNVLGNFIAGAISNAYYPSDP